MASTFNAKTAAKIQTAVGALCTALGQDIDMSKSAGFTIQVTVNPDGQSLFLRAWPGEGGGQNLRPATKKQATDLP